MFNGFFSDVKEWIVETAEVLRREFALVFSDVGVMIFFFLLPIVYPVVYSLIYNPEVTRDMPVVVVDNCRTARSREFVRHADATQAIKIAGYAANMEEARRWMNEKKCYAIFEIPGDYDRKIGRGEQGVIQFYAEVSLLLRYRTFLSSLTELQIETDADIRQESLDALGVGPMMTSSNVQTEAFFLGDPQQGFASFILPGIIVLILQQSMLLGITMLEGTSNERRRRNGGIDPRQIPASTSATVIGKTLCFTMIYLPLSIYVLHFIPSMFSFPHLGHLSDYILFILPLLLATAFLGQALQVMVWEREASFVVVVFTSVIFLFLSGLTWPRYAMAPFWKWMGDIVPATWGMEGFININNNGASLAEESHAYHWLWGLTAAYFVISYLITRVRRS